MIAICVTCRWRTPSSTLLIALQWAVERQRVVTSLLESLSTIHLDVYKCIKTCLNVFNSLKPILSSFLQLFNLRSQWPLEGILLRFALALWTNVVTHFSSCNLISVWANFVQFAFPALRDEILLELDRLNRFRVTDNLASLTCIDKNHLEFKWLTRCKSIWLASSENQQRESELKLNRAEFYCRLSL